MVAFARSELSVTEHHLRTKYLRILPGIYADRGTKITAFVRAEAAWKWSRGEGALVGRSAAAVLGVKWVPDDSPAEVATSKRAPSVGIIGYRDVLKPDEVQRHGAMVVTTPLRTSFDLARRLPFDEAVVMVDALGQLTGLTPRQLAEFAQRYPRARGQRQLRDVVAVADPGAQSPWETHSRLTIVRGKLPRPKSQHVIRVHGKFVARVDLAWPEWKVAVEYDGSHHFTDQAQARRDVERWNALTALGWTVIRVTKHQLRDGGATLVEQIRQVLRAAGAPV